MSLRIALAQINTVVGDLKGNAGKIVTYLDQARKAGAHIVVFPELVITGYPPEDLLLKPQFIADNRRCLSEVAAASTGILSVVGFVDIAHSSGRYPEPGEEGRIGADKNGLFNAAALCGAGRVIDCYHKMFLPNYGVFDEKRYFRPGQECAVYRLPVGDDGDKVTFGVNVCEDIWYPEGPTLVQARRGGARLVLNCNSSPYYWQKWRVRQDMLARRARDSGAYLLYVNLVGGQDELVFDGHSLVFGPDGGLLGQGAQFDEAMIFVDLPISALVQSEDASKTLSPETPYPHGPDVDVESGKYLSSADYIASATASTSCRVVDLDEEVAGLADLREPGVAGPDEEAFALPRVVISGGVEETLPEHEEVYSALLLGLRDYVEKNEFTKVVIGLSGGIDSALVAAIAVDALGAENVVGVNMPSMYSSLEGIEDALATAANLGIECKRIPINSIHKVMLDELEPHFAGTEPGVAEENLQARIRGNIMMSLSNKFGWMVLTTGNKSEMACGYATLYGDMAGGFAVLKDVPKTLVYRLAEWRNRKAAEAGAIPPIPQRVIDKEPSAELRPNQKDSDSLPPYEILDPILEAYVEEDKSPEEIAAMGFDPVVVAKVALLVDRNEYKRRQSPPGIKITPKAFGKDRRMPITNHYRFV